MPSSFQTFRTLLDYGAGGVIVVGGVVGGSGGSGSGIGWGFGVGGSTG